MKYISTTAELCMWFHRHLQYFFSPGLCQPWTSFLYGHVVYYSGHTPSDIAVFICDPGYSLVGRSMSLCILQEGVNTSTWNINLPTCVRDSKLATDDGHKSSQCITIYLAIQNLSATFLRIQLTEECSRSCASRKHPR